MTDFHADRRAGIGGSDARAILEGRWHQLWLEKTGREKRTFTAAEQFRMNLGTAAEPAILDEWRRRHPELWGEKPANQIIHPTHNFVRCHLDFFGGIVRANGDAPKTDFIGEIKLHLGDDSLEEMALFYTPQVQHNLYCALAPSCWFVVAFGHYGRYAELEIEADLDFQRELVEREEEFWSYVVADIEPPDAKPAKLKIALDKMRVVCMDRSNSWSSAALDFVETEPAARRFDAAKKILKDLVEDDVRLAFGHGVVAKRDGRGVTIKPMTDDQRKEFYPEEAA